MEGSQIVLYVHVVVDHTICAKMYLERIRMAIGICKNVNVHVYKFHISYAITSFYIVLVSTSPYCPLVGGVITSIVSYQVRLSVSSNKDIFFTIRHQLQNQFTNKKCTFLFNKPTIIIINKKEVSE